MRRGATALATALALCVAVPAAGQEVDPSGPPIVVSSKPFPESRLLGELFARKLEARGYPVERRLALKSTEVLMSGMRAAAIDVYPEYTGTGLMAVLKHAPDPDPARVFRTVSREFASRWGIHWLPSLGFENTYAMAVRRETAEQHGLATLSDLARVGTQIRGGFSPDFIPRPDGLAGLAKVYGLELASQQGMDPGLKYRAIADGAVDLVDGYSTDGEIAKFGLVVLRDDQRFFPPYDCCPLVSRRLWEQRPGAVQALLELCGRIDVATMQRWNAAMAVDKEPMEAVAARAMEQLGVDTSAPATAAIGEGLLAYAWFHRGRVARETGRHLLLVAVALLLGCLVAIPLGVWLERVRGAAETVVAGTGLLQTIPSIALLALMVPLLAIGFWPAIVALFLYSLYPIVRSTYTGVRDADPSAVAAGTALGMTPGQVLRHVRLPLAAPFIMSGVRTAAVITVGTATLAAFIGAGGLGDPIQEGLSMLDNRLILLGAIPAAVLALLVDGGLALVERAVRPKGV